MNPHSLNGESYKKENTFYIPACGKHVTHPAEQSSMPNTNPKYKFNKNHITTKSKILNINIHLPHRKTAVAHTRSHVDRRDSIS